LRFSFDCQLGLHRLLNDGTGSLTTGHILNNPSSNSFLRSLGILPGESAVPRLEA